MPGDWHSSTGRDVVTPLQRPSSSWKTRLLAAFFFAPVGLCGCSPNFSDILTCLTDSFNALGASRFSEPYTSLALVHTQFRPYVRRLEQAPHGRVSENSGAQTSSS